MYFRLTVKNTIMTIESVSVRGAKQKATRVLKAHTHFQGLGYDAFYGHNEGWREVSFDYSWRYVLPRVNDEKVIRSAELRRIHNPSDEFYNK